MKKMSVIVFSLFMGVFMTVGAISDAEAKRMGGGKSFGSKSFQNKPAKRTSTAPSKAQTQNADKKAALAKKGGMMGLLGGLMIGGLLGAMFFGGAFENINFMDILLFAGIAFILFKLISSRRRQNQPETANGAPIPPEDANNDNIQTRQASNDFGGGNADSTNNVIHEEPENMLERGKIPRSFDQKSFLTGAENVYTLLQKAWDNGDLADLRQFCNDEVFGELQDQIRARTGNSTTEIIALKSELVNFTKSGNRTEVTVIFHAELNEHDNNEQTSNTHIQEAWYFVRPDNRNEHNWLLDAIQQLEN